MATPWPIYVRADFVNGWELEICYKCISSVLPAGKTFNWILKQNRNCQAPNNHIEYADI